MKRQIKFRAWDKKQKKMMWGGQVHFSLPLSLDVFEFHETTIHKNPFDYDLIMQFTGLLDKSAKEIYEGDLVKCEDGSKSTITWNNDYASFCYGNEPYIGLGSKEILEVIGNIYENPELI